MPNHPDMPFDDWHKGRFNSDTTSELPDPEGTGDVYYAIDTKTLYIANADGTGWNSYPMTTTINPVHNLEDLIDVESAVQYTSYVLATGDGLIGGTYRGRKLVAADLPNLDAAKFTTGVLLSRQGGTGTGTPATGDMLRGNRVGTLTRFPVGVNGQFLVTFQSGFQNGFSDGFGITNPFTSGFDLGFNGLNGFSSGFSGGCNGYTKGGGIRYQTYDVDTTFYGVSISQGAVVSNSVLVTVNWTGATEDFDTDNMFDVAVQPTRITFNHEGYYHVLTTWNSYNNTDTVDTNYNILIRLNGTTVIAETRSADNLSTLYHFNVGDYVELRVNAPNAFTLLPYFSAYRVSRQ